MCTQKSYNPLIRFVQIKSFMGYHSDTESYCAISVFNNVLNNAYRNSRIGCNCCTSDFRFSVSAGGTDW